MTEQRLIDANNLTRWLETVLSNANPLDRKARAAFSEALTRVNTMPVVDAVPVVRCRDCKYYRQQRPDAWSDNPMRCDHPEVASDLECYDAWLEVGPDDFCSRGERRMEHGI